MEIKKSRIKTHLLSAAAAAEAESRVVPGGSAYIVVVNIIPRVESRVPRARWTNTSPRKGAIQIYYDYNICYAEHARSRQSCGGV